MLNVYLFAVQELSIMEASFLSISSHSETNNLNLNFFM